MSGPKLTDEEAQCSAAPNDEQQEKKEERKIYNKKITTLTPNQM